MGLECIVIGSQVKGLSFPYQDTVKVYHFHPCGVVPASLLHPQRTATLLHAFSSGVSRRHQPRVCSGPKTAPAGPRRHPSLSTRSHRMMRPHVPTQQMQPSAAPRTTHPHTSPSGRRLPPPSTHSASCLTSYTLVFGRTATRHLRNYQGQCLSLTLLHASHQACHTLSTSSISLTRSALPGRAMHTDADSQELQQRGRKRGRKRGQPRGEGHRGRHR